MPIRIGIVGARRSRQGIGEHVARHLAQLGAQVVAIVGTRRETVEQARCHLEQRYGLHVRSYTALEHMLAAEVLDAVAICSPQECHRQHLRQALAARVHVLCEKPLVFEPGRDPVADARPLVEGFAGAGKVLMVNEQWPLTLDGFQRLFPDVAFQHVPRKLGVLLSPDAVGAEMIPNSLPHALSLLFALAPARGQVEGIRVSSLAREDGASTAAEVGFRYRHTQGTTEVTVVLRRAALQPRPAGYTVDGRAVRRHIEMPEYRTFLETVPKQECGASHANALSDRPRRVPVEDPLRLLLVKFLDHCRQASRGAGGNAEIKTDATILQRLAILHDVYQQACQHF